MTDKGAILVVDDDTESLRLLTNILTADGYRVRPADSGELALASLIAELPELILLDVRMPELDGFEVCRRIKASEQSRRVPVLFLTAASEPDLEVEGLSLGAVDFIRRPFRREELLVRIQSHLELGRLRVSLEKRVAEQTAELRAANEQLEREVIRKSCAEAALRKSGELARLAMQTGRMYGFEWNPATDEARRSHDCTDILGASGSMPDTGQNWFRHIHPDDRQPFIHLIDSLNPANDTYHARYRVFRDDGLMLHLR